MARRRLKDKDLVDKDIAERVKRGPWRKPPRDDLKKRWFQRKKDPKRKRDKDLRDIVDDPDLNSGVYTMKKKHVARVFVEEMITKRKRNAVGANKVNFSFSGWVIGADVKKALDVDSGKEIDVTGMTSEELVAKLNSGELAISLGDYLYDNRDAEIGIFDFEE